MFPQFKDLVTRYKPSIIFSDGEWDLSDTAWRSEELLAWLFNESPVAAEVVVNDRWGKNTRSKNNGSTYATSEYGSGMDATVVWEESQGIGHSYGYNRNEQLSDYKTSPELILMLCDIVARGGNLLLDIGPTADGRIPVIMQQRLTDIGDWLKVNGEAIYGTRAWKVPAQWSAGYRPEKKDAHFMADYKVARLVMPKKDTAFIECFFTRKNKDLFCIVPSWRENIVLKDIQLPPASSATLLGTGRKISWKQTGKNAEIDLTGIRPGELPASGIFVIRLSNALPPEQSEVR
jgi:alpha-L-fucosidase